MLLKRKPAFLLIILVTLVTAGGVYLNRQATPQVEALSKNDSRDIWNGDRCPASGDGYRRYRFRREISATSGTQALLKFDLRGTLDLTQQGMWVRASFTLDKTKEHPGLTSSIPFYFLLNEKGEITEIRSSGDTDQQSILKDLAFLYAFRTPIDTAGNVEMTLKDQVDAGEFTKQKVQYLGTVGKLVKIKKSEHRIRKDLSLLAGAEVTLMGQIESQAKYQLKLEKFDAVVKTPINPSLIKQFAVMPLISHEKVVESKTVLSWKVLKAQLTRVGKSKSPQRMKLFHELIRTLKHHPEAMTEFKNWMSDRRSEGEAGHRDFLFGMGVLASVGTPLAQKNLQQFYQQVPDTAILDSLTTMSAMATSETRSFLKELALSKDGDESMAALLALGRSVRPEANASDEDSIVNLILVRFRHAISLSEKMDVLDAMGNSGNAKFFPTLTTIIRNPAHPQMIVTKAIYAMRLMQTQEAQLTLQSMSTDRAYQAYQSIIQSTLSFANNN